MSMARSSRLTPRQESLVRQAEERGYLLLDREDRPYIRVKRLRRVATITVDLLTVDWCAGEVRFTDEALTEVRDLFRTYAAEGSECARGRQRCDIYLRPSEHCEGLVRELVRLANGPASYVVRGRCG
jgi:hypothetical protein